MHNPSPLIIAKSHTYMQYKSDSCELHSCKLQSKLYLRSTLNIDLILWHTQLIVCAENVKSLFKSWVFPFPFQSYILPYKSNCMCVVCTVLAYLNFTTSDAIQIKPKALVKHYCAWFDFYCIRRYLNFRAVLVLPKTAVSAQSHKSMSFI